MAPLVVFACASARAQLTWDADEGTTGIQDGTGTWDTGAGKFWDGAANVAWTGGNSAAAVFGGGDAGMAGEVVLSGPITLNSLTFNPPNAGNYSLSGGSLRFGGTAPSLTAKSGTTVAVTGGLTTDTVGTASLSFTAEANAALNLNFTSITRNNGNPRTFTFKGAGTGTLQSILRDPSNDGPVSLAKNESGTWTLAANNYFAGGVTINNGTLAATSNIGNAGVSVSIAVTTGSNQATVSEADAAKLAVGMVVGGGQSLNRIPMGTTIAAISGTTVTLSANATGANATITAPFGFPNALGISGDAVTNFVLNGSTATFSHQSSTAASTNRLFRINANGGGLDASGTAAGATLGFTHTGAVSLGGTTSRTFRLSGTHTGDNTFAPSLGDPTEGQTSLTKSGTGKWILTGSHGYTGATTITNGTLALGSGGALANGTSVTIAAGATFDVTALTASSATYTWNASSLSANGTTIAATVAGTAGGTVDLDGKPVTLTWSGASFGTDTTHPPLTVTGADLSFDATPFTIVVPGTALGIGEYTLVSAAAISPGSSVNPVPLYTGGNGLAPGLIGIVSISGSTVVLTVAADSTYTLTYDGNGNTGGTAPVDGNSPYPAGSTVTVLGSGSLARTGFTFTGWNTAADGSGTPRTPSGTFTITENTTLFAQWSAASTFSSWIAGFDVGALDGLNHDPDGDGQPNFLEFALNSQPDEGGSVGRTFLKLATVGAETQVLTLTVAVRDNAAAFATAGNNQQALDPTDNLTYLIEASNNLTDWGTPVVTPVTGGDAALIQSGLPAPDAGWSYQTFRTDGNATSDPAGFIRVKVTTP